MEEQTHVAAGGGPAVAGPPRPKTNAAVTVEYAADASRETVLVHRLPNTRMIRWAQTGFPYDTLVFWSVERPGQAAAVDQGWFDSLTQDSALEVVEQALALNHSPALQKKILEPAIQLLESWAKMQQALGSPTPPASSAAGGSTPTS